MWVAYFAEARTTLLKSLYSLLVGMALACTVQGGVLVYRSPDGLKFGEAVSVTVNGKDKALGLGSQPKLTGPAGKLPQVKLGGTLLKDADSATIGMYEQGEMNYLLPEGVSKNAVTDPAAMWAAANILYKKTEKDKTPSEVAGSAFVAFVPEGLEQLMRICQDQRALALIGGKLKAFPAQIELIAAVVKANPSNAATAPLETYVAQFMRQRYDRFESGAAGMEALDQGLQFAELSKALYPAAPEHVKLRQALADRKAWVLRKVAILRAFASAREWDEFLLGDREFENYQQAFPEMIDKHSEALKQSLQLHRQAGDARLKDREYSAAVREFRLASLRQPSDPTLQQSLLMASTDYSREAAIEHQGGRKQLSAGERAAIDQALSFANGFKQQNKLDEALQQIKQAESIDPRSLPILLKKAEILGARHEFAQALAALDDYDLLALNEERDKSGSLRSELKFQLTSNVGDVKTAIRKAWSDGGYNRTHDQAIQGLRASKDDAELLYYAGMASAVTRNAADSRTYFTRYLEISNTLDANQEQRARVRQLLTKVGKSPVAAVAEEGDANWLSGKKLPKSVYYCPVSLAFQVPIERIEGSNKFKVEFRWQGARLNSMLPVFEKADRVTGEKPISFAYDDKVPQIAAVGDGVDARLPLSSDPDERFKASSVVLLNNPYADPLAIEKLTGKNVTIGIAGNRYFNPFVWEKVYYFRLNYDESGRVQQAREIAGPTGGPGDQWLEFEWNGLQLEAIHGYQGANEKSRIKNYERTMQYQDGRLVSEEIQAGGKSSRIKYAYNAGRLVSAVCDKDTTTDDRSRTVTFR